MRLLFVVLLFLAWSPAATGQRCGLADTIDLGRPGLTVLNIPIEGYLSGQLSTATQGLCNVEIDFQHTYVYGLTLTLVSPAGDSVQLVGPFTDQPRPPTSLARWFVNFQGCDRPADPDPGVPFRWDNRNGYTWPAFGNNTGSYYPASACFDTFNEGSVNGNWQLLIRNSRAGEQGQLTYIRLEFCDDRNAEGPCCFAAAGELRIDPPVVACAEPFDLPVVPQVRYRRPRPDAAAYGYTYLISRNDTIVARLDSPNLAGRSAGSYEVCGLSYRRDEALELVTDSSWIVNTLRTNLNSPTPVICADLTPVCQRVTLLAPPDTTFLAPVLCRGDSYRVGARVLVDSGRHVVTLAGASFCDSVVVVDLNLVDTLYASVDTAICDGAVFALGSQQISTAGVYYDTLTSRFGCDSLVTLTLRVNEPLDTSIVVAICAGDSYTVGNEEVASSGLYTRVIPASNGCDSTIVLDLRVLDPDISYTTFRPQLDCRQDTVVLDASASNLAFATDFSWSTEDGTLLANLLSIEVDEPGAYVFNLTADSRGVTCTSRDTVRILDRRAPIRTEIRARPQVPCEDESSCATLTCASPELTLTAAPFPLSDSYVYDWLGPGVAAGASLANVQVNLPGVYTLQLLDTVTGCGLDTFYTVFQDVELPSLPFNSVPTLTCVTSEAFVTLDTTQPRYTELLSSWEGPCLDLDASGSRATITCGGDYRISLLNTTNGCRADTLLRVAQDTAPVLLNLAPATSPFTCRTGSLNIRPARAEGANPVLFSWREMTTDTLVATSRTARVVAPGRYTLSVVDSLNGCQASRTILVPADTTKPVIDAGPIEVQLDCYADSSLLGTPAPSGANYDYRWARLPISGAPVATTPQLLVRPPGSVYQLRVEDLQNGCVATDEVRVSVDLDTPRVRIRDVLDFDCIREAVVLDAATFPLPATAQHTWEGPCFSGSTTDPVTAARCPGVYTYRVTDLTNGCAAADSVEVGLVEGAIVAALPDTAFIDCLTGTVRLDGSNSTPVPNIRWLFEGQPVSLFGYAPTVTVPGEYSLLLENLDGSCWDTARISVVAPCPVLSVIVPPDSITCRRTSITLDASYSLPASTESDSIVWFEPDNALTVPTANARRLTVFSGGRYGFALRNRITGLFDTAYVDVVVNQRAPVVEAGPTDTLTCYLPELLLGSDMTDTGSLFHHVWTTTDDDTLAFTSRYAATTPGTYLLRVTQTETGCSRVDNVTVVNGQQAPEVTLVDTVIPCDSTEHVVRAVPTENLAYTYNWAGPSILGPRDESIVTVTAPGEYSLQVARLDNGCSISELVDVTAAPCPPYFSLRDTFLSCVEDSTTLRPLFRDGPCVGCSYRWQLSGSDTVFSTETTLRTTIPGRYELRVRNAAGLTARSPVMVTDARTLPNDPAGRALPLTCKRPKVIIGRDLPAQSVDYQYRWRGPAGFSTTSNSTNQTEVALAGAYVLTVRNTISECVAVDTVVVAMDTVKPIANAGPSRLLTCAVKRKVLDGSDSSLGQRYVYRWQGGTAPSCIADGGTLNPTIRCAGRYEIVVTDTINGCQATAPVVVDIDDDLPNIIPVGDGALTCASRSLELVGGDTTGSAISYSWYQKIGRDEIVLEESSPATITVTNGGEFRFELTNNESGCKNDFSFQVTEDFLTPVVDAGPADTFFCNLDTLLLLGTALSGIDDDVVYEWSSRTGFATLAGPLELESGILFPDVYYLRAVNSRNACVGEDSVVIARDVAAPVVEAGNDTTLTCDRASVRLAGQFASNSGQGQIAWTSLLGQELNLPARLNPVVRQAGAYQLVITDPQNNCRGADVLRVSLDTVRPAPQIVVVGALLPELNCNQPTIVLRGSGVMAGQPERFRWSVDANALGTSTSQTATEAGVYSLVMTNERNGCRGQDSIQIAQDFAKPTVITEQPLTLSCSRDSVRLRAVNEGGFTQFWRDSLGQLIGVDAGPWVATPGQYTVTTRGTANGCIDTTAVEVRADYRQPVISLLPPEVLDCDTESVLLDALDSDRGPGFVGVWSRATGGSPVVDQPYQYRATEPGTYRFTLTDLRNGCQHSDNVIVERLAVAIDSIAYTARGPVCPGEADGFVQITDVVGGQAPFNYRLNGGPYSERLRFGNLSPDDYTLSVIGADGCERSAIVTLPAAEIPSVSLREDTLILLGDSVQLDYVTSFPGGTYTARWRLAGGVDIDTTPVPVWVRPRENQTYELEVTGPGGCSASDLVLVEVDGQINYYVPNAFSPNGDVVNDLLRPYVGPQVEAIESFTVYDRWGALVYERREAEMNRAAVWGWDGLLDGRPLQPGQFAWRLVLRLRDGSSVTAFGGVSLLR